MEKIPKKVYDKDREDDISHYPVSNKTFEKFKEADKIKGCFNCLGVIVYRVVQIDEHSKGKIIFYIYKHPMLRTKFTTVKLTDIKIPKK